MIEIGKNSKLAVTNVSKYVDFTPVSNSLDNMGDWMSKFRPFGHKGKEPSAVKPNKDHCKDSSWWPGSKEKSHLVPTVIDKDFEPVAPPSKHFVDLLQDLPLDKKLPDNIREAVAKDLDFYNKSHKLPKLVDFTKVFGPKNSFDKDDADLKKLANNEDDIMKDLEDWMKSKQNMHAMRAKALDFEKSYGGLVVNYEQCLDKMNGIVKDIENKISTVSHPGLDQNNKELDQAENALEKNRREQARLENLFNDDHGKLQGLLKDVGDRLQEFDLVGAEIAYKESDNENAKNKIVELRKENQENYFKIAALEKELKALQHQLGPSSKELNELEAKLKIEKGMLALNEQDLNLKLILEQLLKDKETILQQYISGTNKKISFQNDFKHLTDDLKKNFSKNDWDQIEITENFNTEEDASTYQEILHSYLTLKKKIYNLNEVNWTIKMKANQDGIERFTEQIVDLKEKDTHVYDRIEEIKIEIANLRSNINENSIEIDRL